MAGYRETFGANVDYASSRGGRDIAGSLERGMSSLTGGGGALSAFMKQTRESRRGVQDLNNEIKRLDSEFAFANSVAQFRSLNKQIAGAEENLKRMKKASRQMALDSLAKGAEKVTKGLISMNSSILGMGFNFLISSIKRVYELQERWTKAIGGFNLRIGGMTAGLKGAQAAATAWSSTIRGLTDGDITEGIQMFADFTDAIGRVVEKGDQFQRFGIQLARGFNLGGQGAGQLVKVFENIGNNNATASETMKDLVKSANAAGVPVNLLAKDIQESSVYMARFGKEGQKTFVQGAAWARKFTISMDQLRDAVEGMDMFDEAAKTASKLNATFGTMINSMDLMLEDDPAKRLEMIRQQFLAQGQTFDKLTPRQRRMISQTLKLTEDQIGALLKAESAGESYADFQAKAAKKQEQELSAKQMMEKQLRATAQTMYAFGAAFDRITVAIANAIKPLLVVLGLASDGDKKFGNFGQVMESITVTVEEFFNSLARNEKWNSFMITLAKDLKSAGRALRDFVMDGRAADLIGDIADGMKTFYVFVRDLAIKVAPALRPLLNIFLTLSQHLDKMVIAWAGLKGLSALNGLTGGAGAGQGGGLLSAMTSRGVLTKGGAGGKSAGAAGGMMVGGAAGAMMGGTGATIGGMLGGFLGPIGGIVGAALGKGIEELFSSPKIKSKLEESIESLAKSQNELRDANEKSFKLDTLIQAKRATRSAMAEQSDKLLMSTKSAKIKLDTQEKEIAVARLEQLRNFAKNTGDVDAAMLALKNDTPITTASFNTIRDAQKKYKDIVDGLNIEADKLLQNEKLKSSALKIEAERADFEVRKKETEEVIKQLQAAGAVMAKIGNMAGNANISNTNSMFDVAGADLDGEFERISSSLKSTAAVNKVIGDTQISMKRQEEIYNRSSLDNQKETILIQRRILVAGHESITQEKALALKENRQFDMAQAVQKHQKLIARDTGVQDLGSMYKFATGGIVTRPTVGLVGEAGPEAIIPLNDSRAGNRINYANRGSSGGGGGQTIVTQIADVHLDGQKVGRAIVRTAITGRN